MGTGKDTGGGPRKDKTAGTASASGTSSKRTKIADEKIQAELSSRKSTTSEEQMARLHSSGTTNSRADQNGTDSNAGNRGGSATDVGLPTSDPGSSELPSVNLYGGGGSATTVQTPTTTRGLLKRHIGSDERTGIGDTMISGAKNRRVDNGKTRRSYTGECSNSIGTGSGGNRGVHATELCETLAGDDTAGDGCSHADPRRPQNPTANGADGRRRSVTKREFCKLSINEVRKPAEALKKKIVDLIVVDGNGDPICGGVLCILREDRCE